MPSPTPRFSEFATLDLLFFFAGPGAALVVVLTCAYALDLFYRFNDPHPTAFRRYPLSGFTGLLTGGLLLLSPVAWYFGAISSGVLLVVAVGLPLLLYTVGIIVARKKQEHPPAVPPLTKQPQPTSPLRKPRRAPD